MSLQVMLQRLNGKKGQESRLSHKSVYNMFNILYQGLLRILSQDQNYQERSHWLSKVDRSNITGVKSRNKKNKETRCKNNMEFWEGEVYFPIQKYIHMFVSHVDQKKMLGVSIILIFLPCFRILMIWTCLSC